MDYQLLWKKSIDILVFLHGVNHQEKVAQEIIAFGKVWLRLYFLCNPVERNFDQQFHWKKTIDIFDFFGWS